MGVGSAGASNRVVHRQLRKEFPDVGPAVLESVLAQCKSFCFKCGGSKVLELGPPVLHLDSGILAIRPHNTG